MDYVLSIGIDSYKNDSLNRLRCCVNDAKDIADAFKTLFGSNAQVYTFYNEGATFDKIMEWKDTISFYYGDRFFVYFSGHGKNKNGKPCLICYDATEEDVIEEKNCISVTDFIEELTTKGVDLFFFADACESAIAPVFFSRSGELSGNTKYTRLNEKNRETNSDGGISYFSSADYCESAYELDVVDHGIWTRALIKALRTDIAYDRGALTTTSLQEYLKCSVIQYLRDQGLKIIQTPQRFEQYSSEMVIYRSDNLDFKTSGDLPENYDSYAAVNDYMPRTVSNNQKDADCSDLYQAIQKYRKIVLISNAGAGKTTETRQLAYRIKSDSSIDIPVLIELSAWEGESIESLIRKTLPGNLGDNHVLIMDGYDEINDSKMQDFAYRINMFIKNHPNNKILVSVRSNRYRMIAREENEGTFSGFQEYLLNELSDSEIERYAENQGVDVHSFMISLRVNRLYTMATNPFYLLALLKIFKERNYLPQPTDVLEYLINLQFDIDESRYNDTLEDYDLLSVKSAVSKMAFAMQCRQIIDIDFNRYKDITQDRGLEQARKCGLIKRKKDKWTFVHNNFREYLAAKYITRLDINSIKRLVTVDVAQQQVGYSWENVLSFLALLDKREGINEWLIEICPECLIQYEVDFKSDVLNFQIVKGILEQCKKYNCWLSMIVSSPKAMDHLCTVPTVIDYLLQEIVNRSPIRFKNLANALSLLKRVTNYYGRENDARKLMFSCILDENVRNYEKGIAIEVLGNKKLVRDTDFSAVVSAMDGSVNPELRESLLVLISRTKPNAQSINYVLETCKDAKYGDNSFSCERALRECFYAVKDAPTLLSVFKYICEYNGLLLSTWILNDIYEVLFQRAVELYLRGDRNISNLLKAHYVERRYWADHQFHSRMITYIHETNQSRDVFEYCIEHEVPNPLASIIPILDNSLIDEFADKYTKNLLKHRNIFEQYVRTLNVSSYKYNELCKCVKQVSGIDIPKRADDNTLIMDKEAEKRFYDALFNKDNLKILVRELWECYDNQFLKIGEMEIIPSVEERRDLELLYNMVKRYADYFKDMSIWEWLTSKLIDLIVLLEIQSAMKCHFLDDLSTEQEAFLTEYCYQTIISEDFGENEVEYKEKKTSYTLRSELIAYFSAKLNIEYSVSEYKKLMYLPTMLFGETHEYYVFTPYILNHVVANDILEWISTNVRHQRLAGELIGRSIKFCLENHSNICIEYAMKVVKSDEDDYIKQIALRYLGQYISSDKLIMNYLKEADERMVELLYKVFQPSCSELLLQKMVEMNRESENQMLFLQVLIEREPDYGLNRYYETAKKGHGIPDYKDEAIISPVTESIEKVSTVNNAGMLLQLYKLSASNGFRDRRAFGLRRSAKVALKNVARQSSENFIEVKHLLEETLNQIESGDSFKDDVQVLIYEIKRENYIQFSFPIEWIDIKEYIAEAECTVC